MAVTDAQALAWCGLETADMSATELELFAILLGAVTEHIADKYVVPSPSTGDLAALMQLNRWWLRKDTPGGVIAFDELGAVRVTRLDPDVAAMLDPKVNFA